MDPLRPDIYKMKSRQLRQKQPHVFKCVFRVRSFVFQCLFCTATQSTVTVLFAQMAHAGSINLPPAGKTPAGGKPPVLKLILMSTP